MELRELVLTGIVPAVPVVPVMETVMEPVMATAAIVAALRQCGVR